VLAQLVQQFSEFTTSDLVCESLNVAVPGADLPARLTEANILVEEGSSLALKEDEVDKWPWGHDARCFHFSTQQMAYTFDFEAIREHFEHRAIVDPPPSPFKEYPGPLRPLPVPTDPTCPDFWRILESRRTVRAFRRELIAESVLGTLLHRVWGKLRFYNDSRLDARVIKTSPSGGARHPIEVYVVAQRVEGIPPGVYHYSVRHHALSLCIAGLREDRMVELFSGQSWVRDAAALFFMTAVLPRSMWKYDHARAYRVVQLDAGHLGQTFHLVCTALGLGPFTTAAIQDREIEAELGLDGVWETSIYAAACGFSTTG
jgi:SagB-type dehydrogenase family enzyme